MKISPEKKWQFTACFISCPISRVYIPGYDFMHLFIYCIIVVIIFSEGAGSISTLSETASVNVERIRALMESENNRSLESLQKAIVFINHA